MVELMKQYWPYVLLIAGVIGAVTKFYLDWVKIKEARTKIIEAEIKTRDLQFQLKEKESRIYQPTTEEIEHYSSSPVKPYPTDYARLKTKLMSQMSGIVIFVIILIVITIFIYLL